MGVLCTYYSKKYIKKTCGDKKKLGISFFFAKEGGEKKKMTTIITKKIVLVGGMYMCGVCECVKKKKSSSRF